MGLLRCSILSGPLRSVSLVTVTITFTRHPRDRSWRGMCSTRVPSVVLFPHIPPAEPPEPEIRNEDAIAVKQDISKHVIAVDEEMDVRSVSGVPEEHMSGRRARIFQSSKNAMQSGTADTHTWALELETRQRWENPTMGWCSSGDPLSNLRLVFTTREDAARFCDKNGWTYFVEEPFVRKPLRKSYADNFSWDKRTRVGSK